MCDVSTAICGVFLQNVMSFRPILFTILQDKRFNPDRCIGIHQFRYNVKSKEKVATKKTGIWETVSCDRRKFAFCNSWMFPIKLSLRYCDKNLQIRNIFKLWSKSIIDLLPIEALG